MKKLDDAAHEWVFETNGHKWSNNDDTAGDNFGSFIAGAKWQKEKELDRLKELEKEKYKYFFECGRNYQLTGEGTFKELYNETFKQEEQNPL